MHELKLFKTALISFIMTGLVVCSVDAKPSILHKGESSQKATLTVSVNPISSCNKQQQTNKPAVSKKTIAQQAYFIRNQGQVHKDVAAYSNLKGYTLWAAKDRLVFDASARDQKSNNFVSMKFLNATPTSVIEMKEPGTGRVNYLMGNNRSKWITDIGTYRELVYKDVWRNIDLRVYLKGAGVEYDFVIKPGGKTEDIRLSFEGLKGRPEVEASGDLRLAAESSAFLQKRPKIYQMEGNRKIEVKGGFRADKKGVVGFEVANYQKDKTLIIDPTVELVYSTYLGGSAYDAGVAVTTDANGYIYLMANTRSSDFPPGTTSTGSLQGSLTNVVVSKMSADGQSLIYTTYIGGTSSGDYCLGTLGNRSGIAVNSSGNVYITGVTDASDFPTQNGISAYTGDCSNKYDLDVFVMRLNADGSGILYSTLMGTTLGSYDQMAGIGLYGNDYVYFTANKTCNNAGNSCVKIPYPEKNAYQECAAGFIIGMTKIDTSQSGTDSLIFSGCYGTPDGNSIAANAYGMTVDSTGNMYIVGYAGAGAVTATDKAFASCAAGGPFISKFSPDGQQLLYSSCLGADARPHGVAVTDDGLAYVVGQAYNTSFNLKHPFISTGSKNNWQQGFITVVDTAASVAADSLVASSYIPALAPFENNYGYTADAVAVALGKDGKAYVTGSTNEYIMAVDGSYQTSVAGYKDCWVGQVSADGRMFNYSTYLGGSYTDYCYDIAANPDGNVVVTGSTGSSNFPTVNPYQSALKGNMDAFVSILNFTNSAVETLTLSLAGKAIITPGETIDVLLEYYNTLSYAATDTIVQITLPAVAKFVSASSGGIYKEDTHEVFWKLGTLAAGGSGLVSVQIEYMWGLPGHYTTDMNATIDAYNSPTHVLKNLSDYINYEVVTITEDKKLTAAEITAFLNANASAKTLYQMGIAKGFTDFTDSLQRTLSDGTTSTYIHLLRTKPFEVMTVQTTVSGSLARIYAVDSRKVVVFDADGGYVFDPVTKEYSPYSGWAYESSAVNKNSSGKTASSSSCTVTKGKCLRNCLSQQALDYFYDKIIPGLEQGKTFSACTICIAGGGLDADACYKCSTDLSIEKASSYTDAAGEEKSIPGVGEIKTVMECISTCKTSPETYVCAADKLGCAQGFDLWHWIVKNLMNTESYVVQKCDTTTCMWESPETKYCAFCQLCNEAKGNPPCYDPPKRLNKCYKQEVIVAGDPNYKEGVTGDVVPGQSIPYTIHYQNVGTGTAYGVFILDTLDPSLDETTLVINNSGTYSAPTRTITWEAGELASQASGAVSFSVNVKSGVASGTEITNVATVYFPSVPEVTPTNPVVNRVYSLAANPQKVNVNSGSSLAITLTGEEASSASLTYRIDKTPHYGTLTGTPPSVTYTPMTNYNGPDKFTFIVNNGVTDSRAAAVNITVNTNPSDKTPPEVKTTSPESSETDVSVSTKAMATNAYPPVISAKFSEPIDSSTVTDSTFLVSGLTGTVSYDSSSWTASFTPTTALEYGTTYTATLTTGITDSVGNPLPAYSWTFTTKYSSSTYNVTANAKGTGTGSMASSATGISYSYPAQTTGVAAFSSGATVVLTATAGSGSTASWQGTCVTAGGTEAGNGTGAAICQFSSLSAAKAATATFTQLYSKITAKAKGTGKGKIVSAPSGISFIYPKKKTGSGTYKNASTVKMTAKANAGSKVSWNKTCKQAGGAEKGDNTRTAVCTIKVIKSVAIKATFTKSKKAGDGNLEIDDIGEDSDSEEPEE